MKVFSLLFKTILGHCGNSQLIAFYCRLDLAMVTRRDGTLTPKVEHVELLATQAVLGIETILLENNNVRKLA